MAKLKKIKKWGSRSRLAAERAEAAAGRSEAALARIIQLTTKPAPKPPAGETANSGTARRRTPARANSRARGTR